MVDGLGVGPGTHFSLLNSFIVAALTALGFPKVVVVGDAVGDGVALGLAVGVAVELAFGVAVALPVALGDADACAAGAPWTMYACVFAVAVPLGVGVVPVVGVGVPLAAGVGDADPLGLGDAEPLGVADGVVVVAPV